jgi:hypothetical protein
MDSTQELRIIRKLTEFLDQLNIVYAIGGSIASSVYGVVRFTQDADITVEPFSSVADELYEMLKDGFYISKQAMYQALESRGSFNVIHFETSFKIDIFVQADDDFEKQLLARSRKINLGELLDKALSFISPEDIILLKLKWYSQGGRASERQWSDILGILAVQRERLDLRYLAQWAVKLGLNELLQKAMAQRRT